MLNSVGTKIPEMASLHLKSFESKGMETTKNQNTQCRIKNQFPIQLEQRATVLKEGAVTHVCKLSFNPSFSWNLGQVLYLPQASVFSPDTIIPVGQCWEGEVR